MAVAMPTILHFSQKYNAASLLKWATNPATRERCMTTRNAPTLGMLDMVYGWEAAVGWLRSAMSNINGYLNLTAEKEISESQLNLLAISWVSEYPQLKCSEVWVFLMKLFAGRYGQVVYGSVNPMAIGAALEKYLTERRALEYEQLQRERQAQREREDAEYEKSKEETKALFASEGFKNLPEDQQKAIKFFIDKITEKEKDKKDEDGDKESKAK